MPFQISLKTHKTVLWLSNFRGLSSGKIVTLHIKIVRGTPLKYIPHTQKKQIKLTLRFLHASCLVNNRKVEPIIYQFPTTIESTNTHTQPIKVHTHTQYTENNNNKHLPQNATFMRNKEIYKYVNIWTVKKKKQKTSRLCSVLIFILLFVFYTIDSFCYLFNFIRYFFLHRGARCNNKNMWNQTQRMIIYLKNSFFYINIYYIYTIYKSMYVSINNYLTILILVETFYIELLLYKPFFSRVKTKQKNWIDDA